MTYHSISIINNYWKTYCTYVPLPKKQLENGQRRVALTSCTMKAFERGVGIYVHLQEPVVAFMDYISVCLPKQQTAR